MDYKQQILNILHSAVESRVSMTKTLQITKAWVTKLTSSLLEAGIIEAREVKDSPFGRPQQMLAVKARQFYSLNIMMRSYGLQATLNDYNTLQPTAAAVEYPLHAPLSARQLADTVSNLLAELCGIAVVDASQVRQIGLALGGGIEQHSGVVRWSPVLKEHHYNLRELLRHTTGIATQVVNIAWCSCHMLNKRIASRDSWIALMPGFGSLGYGYCINGKPGLGDNGFYPEIVHLPYAGGLENALQFDATDTQQSAARAAAALCFAICCTAPIHNIKRVILSGELFEDYADLIIPLTAKLLADNPSEHINTIRLEYMPAPYNYSMFGLVQLSSDAITDSLI
ncbi:hypothetical protein N5923_15460 [Erwiniaceae bacterium BAC15a-03b]|uniref:ROK family protein n=1 Tax=Winslowiella arboricola TaxID=2978220 RepID=A0A9J6PKQ3_9GAMM|nr:hypothetical protein [Winslowiella arboricola]MCU5774342.1 hypothetical protein [Winslowiella arboricola]MCU5778889.1 hypothetical protein [Winslowiella arboricola]